MHFRKLSEAPRLAPRAQHHADQISARETRWLRCQVVQDSSRGAPQYASNVCELARRADGITNLNGDSFLRRQWRSISGRVGRMSHSTVGHRLEARLTRVAGLCAQGVDTTWVAAVVRTCTAPRSHKAQRGALCDDAVEHYGTIASDCCGAFHILSHLSGGWGTDIICVHRILSIPAPLVCCLRGLPLRSQTQNLCVQAPLRPRNAGPP